MAQRRRGLAALFGYDPLETARLVARSMARSRQVESKVIGELKSIAAAEQDPAGNPPKIYKIGLPPTI